MHSKRINVENIKTIWNISYAKNHMKYFIFQFKKDMDRKKKSLGVQNTVRTILGALLISLFRSFHFSDL